MYYSFFFFNLYIEVLADSNLRKCLKAMKCLESRMETLQIFKISLIILRMDFLQYEKNSIKHCLIVKHEWKHQKGNDEQLICTSKTFIKSCIYFLKTMIVIWFRKSLIRLWSNIIVVMQYIFQKFLLSTNKWSIKLLVQRLSCYCCFCCCLMPFGRPSPTKRLQ